jgi:hypothetical protein
MWVVYATIKLSAVRENRAEVNSVVNTKRPTDKFLSAKRQISHVSAQLKTVA